MATTTPMAEAEPPVEEAEEAEVPAVLAALEAAAAALASFTIRRVET